MHLRMSNDLFLGVFIFINRSMELLEMIKDNGDGTFGIVAPCSFEKPSREEALKLADLMIDVTDCESSDFYKAGQMIRRLVDRIAELEKQGEPVAWMEYIQDEEWEVWYTKPTDLPEGHSYKPLYLAPQTKPLSDEEIKQIEHEISGGIACYDDFDFVEFARAIEERHGIK